MQVSCLACSFRLFERTFVLMTGNNENKSLWLQHKQLQSKWQSASSPMTSGVTWHSRGMSMLAQSWACPPQLLLTLPSRDVCCGGNCLLLQLNSFHSVNFQLKWLGSGTAFLKFSFCSNMIFFNWGDSSRLSCQTSRSDLWLQNCEQEWCNLSDHGPGLQAWGQRRPPGLPLFLWFLPPKPWPEAIAQVRHYTLR